MKLSHTLLTLTCIISLGAAEELHVSAEDSNAGMTILLARIASRTPSPISTRTPSPMPQESIGTGSNSSSFESMPLKSILKIAGQPKTEKKSVTFNMNLNESKAYEKYLTKSDVHPEPSDSDQEISESYSEYDQDIPKNDNHDIKQTAKIMRFAVSPITAGQDVLSAAHRSKQEISGSDDEYDLELYYEISSSDNEDSAAVDPQKSTTVKSFLPWM